MTNRKLAAIVKDQTPLLLAEHETVQRACCRMWERRSGSVLVVDEEQRLTGIFTGRDAVRALAEGKKLQEARLSNAETGELLACLGLPPDYLGSHPMTPGSTADVPQWGVIPAGGERPAQSGAARL